MTLILAIRASDGIVLASDSQATFRVSGAPVRMPEEKIFQLGPLAWGASGQVGLAQRVKQALDGLGPKALQNRTLADWRNRLRNTVVPVLKEASSNFTGIPRDDPPALDILFCGWIGGGPFILEINKSGQDEQHEHREMCAIGSGDAVAYHACHSLAHYAISTRSLEECKWLAYRVVDSAIEIQAFALGQPIQMWQITAEGARRLQDEELKNIRDAVGSWKEYEKEALADAFERFPPGANLPAPQ